MTVDREHVQTTVRRLTGLPARDVTELGRGTDSVAYLVDHEWVFRFPMVPAARDSLRTEIALLPRLRPGLPLATPEFEHFGRAGRELLFVGYRVLPGVPLTAERVAALGRDDQERALDALAGFLGALHAFPLETARHARVVERMTRGAYHDRQRDLPRQLAHLLTAAEVAHLDGVFARYERDHAPHRQAPGLLHADLKPAHIVYDVSARRVTGVLDWGDVSLGDPDFDLAVIAMFFGREFLGRLLAHLPSRDPDRVLDKTLFFTTLRWLQDLAYVVERGDHQATAPSLARLRAHVDDTRR